mmetsp:Transcript_12557/g.48226  ORF Transcript_12557/g.48226 Transcript_12557/m.48226 type:complete len:237 (-) Transcript_12557:815-1525(-)
MRALLPTALQATPTKGGERRLAALDTMNVSPSMKAAAARRWCTATPRPIIAATDAKTSGSVEARTPRSAIMPTTVQKASTMYSPTVKVCGVSRSQGTRESARLSAVMRRMVTRVDHGPASRPRPAPTPTTTRSTSRARRSPRRYLGWSMSAKASTPSDIFEMSALSSSPAPACSPPAGTPPPAPSSGLWGAAAGLPSLEPSLLLPCSAGGSALSARAAPAPAAGSWDSASSEPDGT